MRRIPEIGTLYRYKPTGETFRFEGDPDDLFLRNQVRVRREDFSESRDVDAFRFERDYEPLTILGLPVVTDPTMAANCVSIWSDEGVATLMLENPTGGED